MKSVYAKVLLWTVGTLVFSIVSFIAISFFLFRRDPQSSLPYRLNTYLLDEVADAYRSGGAAQARALLEKQGNYFRAEFHFTDAKGKDLITGHDYSAEFPEDNHPTMRGGKRVELFHDHSGEYRLLVAMPQPRFDMRPMYPYYAMILLAMAGLLWLLSMNLAAPLRELAKTVERFGAGDLAARVTAHRGDEIGDLGRSFNRMAERIETLLTAERRLLQDISHELRSPLARLSFAAELTRTATDRNAAVARLRKEIGRLADLVSGLIEVTRAEGELSELRLKPVDLKQLVGDVCDSCGLEAQAKQCRIETHELAEVSTRGDAELLRRAVENIVRNAIRYAPEGTPVAVDLKANGSAAVVQVRDLGPGVPDEMQSKIFTPFFRVDPSRDTSTGGVGLGLAIAQRAVLLHHGTIEARNASPGLEVTITLPLTRL